MSPRNVSTCHSPLFNSLDWKTFPCNSETLTRTPGMKDLSVAELKELLAKKGKKWMLGRIRALMFIGTDEAMVQQSHRERALLGCCPTWRVGCYQCCIWVAALNSIMKQMGPGTFFQTKSSAEMHWGDLKRLLNYTDDNKFEALHKRYQNAKEQYKITIWNSMTIPLSSQTILILTLWTSTLRSEMRCLTRLWQIFYTFIGTQQCFFISVGTTCFPIL